LLLVKRTVHARIPQSFTMDTPTVPFDIWICGGCKGGNYIENAPTVCPVCSHERDYGIGCCANPGETTWSTGLFSTEHEPQHRHCEEPLDGHSVPSSALSSSTHGLWSVEAFNVHTGSFSGAGIETRFAPGSRNYVTQHPLHRHCEAATLQHTMPPGVKTAGGAGSQGDGVWICANCGEPNAAFHWPQCGDCLYIHSQ
jgi:hypothetical protein